MGNNSVYKVLDNQTVIKNQGRFTKEKLAEIWNDRKYSEMRDELLQLMMRFKLCYEIPNQPGNYIAPQLLEIEPPQYTWNKWNNLILRYKYEFMPKGIITRFIVETHDLIEQQNLVWRSGVILNQYGARAEVIENYNQREIKVRVCGNQKKELLAIVNRELEKIHGSFERLQYKTLVPCNCTECVESENPYSYPLEELRKRLTKNKLNIECGKSYEMVDVRRLIDDVNLSTQQENDNYKVPDIQPKPPPIWNGKKLKELRHAIINAYPDKIKLKIMLSDELEENLDSITTGENMEEIVFELIEWAKAGGRLEELVKAACQYNPGNSQLKRISEKIF